MTSAVSWKDVSSDRSASNNRPVHPACHTGIPGMDLSVLCLQKSGSERNRKDQSSDRERIRRDLRDL